MADSVRKLGLYRIGGFYYSAEYEQLKLLFSRIQIEYSAVNKVRLSNLLPVHKTNETIIQRMEF